LEPAHTAARVGQREDDATLEIVVPAAIREPHGEQLLLRVTLLRRTRRQPCPTRRVAEPKLAADVLAEPPRREVLPRRRPGLRLPKPPRVDLGGPLEQRSQPVVALPPPLLLRRRLLVLELDAEAPRQHLDRSDEVDVLCLLDEGDRVTSLA